MREHLVNLALKLVGCPYIWGGGNPWTGLDCSGFVIWIYQVFGLLPSGDWTAAGLLARFIEGQDQALQPGDLVFYGPRLADGVHVTHVMLFFSDDLVVGASGGGHLTTSVEEARKHGAQVKVKRLRYRDDLAAAVHVKFPGE